jgi:hypothetical protein
MIIVRLVIFAGLLFAMNAGMAHLMEAYPSLNHPLMGIGNFHPHSSTLLWAVGLLFSGWVAISIK